MGIESTVLQEVVSLDTMASAPDVIAKDTS